MAQNQKCDKHEWKLICKFSGWYLRCKICREATGAKSYNEPRPPGLEDTWTNEIQIPEKKKGST